MAQRGKVEATENKKFIDVYSSNSVLYFIVLSAWDKAKTRALYNNDEKFSEHLHTIKERQIENFCDIMCKWNKHGEYMRH